MITRPKRMFVYINVTLILAVAALMIVPSCVFIGIPLTFGVIGTAVDVVALLIVYAALTVKMRRNNWL